MITGPNIDELERETEERTRRNYGHWHDALEELLNAYLAAFRAVGAFEVTEENRQQQLWLRLVSLCFNSLKWAMVLWKTGYYTQALILARSVFENWLVCMDTIEHGDTVDSLLSGGRLPTFKEMADRSLSSELQQWFYGPSASSNVSVYGFLSTFSHPRFRASSTQVDPQGHTLRVGPHYDETLAIVAYYYVAQAAVKMSEFATRMVPRENQEDVVRTHLQPGVDRANECVDEALTKAKALLDQS